VANCQTSQVLSAGDQPTIAIWQIISVNHDNLSKAKSRLWQHTEDLVAAALKHDDPLPHDKSDHNREHE